jgi:hypothetical protein
MPHYHNPNLAGAGGQGGVYAIDQSLRFNSGDSAYLNRTPASAGNRRTWTFSCWLKLASLTQGERNILFGPAGGGGQFGGVTIYQSSGLRFAHAWDPAGTDYIRQTVAVFRDLSAWYHVVYWCDTTQSGTRWKIYVNGVEQTLETPSGNNGEPSQNTDLPINSTNAHYLGGNSTYGYFSGYLAEVNFIDGSALDPTSFGEPDNNGVWRPIKYAGSYTGNSFYLPFSDATLGTDLTSTATLTAPFGGNAENARTNDASYLTSNTSTGSAFTLLQEDFGSVQQLSRYEIYGLYFTGGTSTWQLEYSSNGSSWAAAATLSVTASGQNFSNYINVNARYVRLRATAFGVNGTGNINALIILQDPLGADASGNDNNWNVNNFSVTAGAGNDVLSDTPTTNYATPNPLDAGSSSLVFSNGNLDIGSAAGNWTDCRSTFAVSSGKWYWETRLNTVATLRPFVGILNSSVRPASNSGSVTEQIGETTNSYAYWAQGGFLRHNAVGTTVTAAVATDIVQVALDMDNGKIYFGLNNTYFDSSGGSTGNPSTGSNPSYSGITLDTVSPAFELYNGTSSVSVNFGQRDFSFTPPTGFKALNTANLPAPSIKDGSDYFNTVIYTGTGSTNNDVTTVGFQPDFTWIKDRTSGNVNFHSLHDSVRGVGNALVTNNDAIESNLAGYIGPFLSNGFRIAPTLSGSNYNTLNNSYVAWNWLAANGTSSIAAGSVDGTNPTIASTVSANSTAGFSIVSFTTNDTAGATVGHGLGVPPDMIIMKYRNLQAYWVVYHKDMNTSPQNGYLNLNFTTGFTTSTDPWNNTAPSSSVITMGAGVGSTGSTNYGIYTSVAYCFAEVEGYSKIGSYTGNGLADGPFVYCGFKPRFLLIKGTNAGSNWEMIDTARDPDNVANQQLFANLTTPYPNYTFGDVVSNGFKIKDNSSGLQGNYNNSGQTYIFAAFAEHPFGGNGVSPATAR